MFEFFEKQVPGIEPKFSAIEFRIRKVLSTLKEDFINLRYYYVAQSRKERLTRKTNKNLFSVFNATELLS